MARLEKELAYIKTMQKKGSSDWLDEALDNQGVFQRSHLDGYVKPVDLLLSICLSFPRFQFESWLKKAFQQAVEALVAKYVKENRFICNEDKIDGLVMLAGLADVTSTFGVFLNLTESEIGKKNYYLHQHLLRLFINRLEWLNKVENKKEKQRLIAVCKRDIKDSRYTMFCFTILCSLNTEYGYEHLQDLIRAHTIREYLDIDSLHGSIKYFLNRQDKEEFSRRVLAISQSWEPEEQQLLKKLLEKIKLSA
ncbi:hypothetical protein D4R86_04445 [bacterium]|nr:MAG: hypothetical protein D4R86_04445 [bacterium]